MTADNEEQRAWDAQVRIETFSNSAGTVVHMVHVPTGCTATVTADPSVFAARREAEKQLRALVADRSPKRGNP